MPDFRKKPVVIEAFRLGVDLPPDWFEIKIAANEIVVHHSNPYQSEDYRHTYCNIKTLEGVMRGDYGDYIIQGVNGEIYPCKPEIFEKTYEPI